MDFTFRTEAKEALFVITRSNTSFSKILLIDMAVAIMIYPDYYELVFDQMDWEGRIYAC